MKRKTESDTEIWLEYLTKPVPPIKIGNKNKSGKCGMCGTSVKKLYPLSIGSVNFMICENCKSIMDM